MAAGSAPLPKVPRTQAPTIIDGLNALGDSTTSAPTDPARAWTPAGAIITVPRSTSHSAVRMTGAPPSNQHAYPRDTPASSLLTSAGTAGTLAASAAGNGSTSVTSM